MKRFVFISILAVWFSVGKSEQRFFPANSIRCLNDTDSQTDFYSYYDLQGRKVANPVRGIYIKDGKKVIIGQ